MDYFAVNFKYMDFTYKESKYIQILKNTLKYIVLCHGIEKHICTYSKRD